MSPARISGVAVAFVCILFSTASAQDRSESIVAGLAARCIGPANMGGRIVDLAVVESNPATYYVAAAGGGVWKTTDGGTTFTPVFDDQPTQCIGAVAVCQAKPDVVYVGTGEANPRNCVSWGNGVYRSTDGGKTWTALRARGHAPHRPHRRSSDEPGHRLCRGARPLLGTERGTRTLQDHRRRQDRGTCAKFIDENTGFVDVPMDPRGSRHALRRGVAGAPRRLLRRQPAIPDRADRRAVQDDRRRQDVGEDGRRDCRRRSATAAAALAVYARTRTSLYAVVQTSETAGRSPTPASRRRRGARTASRATPGKIADRRHLPLRRQRRDLEEGERPRAAAVLLRPDSHRPDRRPAHLRPRRAPGRLDRRRPDVRRHRAARSTPITTRCGSIPKNPKHLIVGNDGGLYFSKDRGQTFDREPRPGHRPVLRRRGGHARPRTASTADFRTTAAGAGRVATPYEDGITLADWRRLIGGDGFQAAVDPTDPNTVYVESQYGGLSRVNLRGGPKGPAVKRISPPAPKGADRSSATTGTRRYCFRRTIPERSTFGAHHVYKSTNRGDAWTRISARSDRTAARRLVLQRAHDPRAGGIAGEGRRALGRHRRRETLADSQRRQGMDST